MVSKSTIGAVGAGVGGIALGGLLGYAATRSRYRKKSRKKRVSRSRNRRKRYNHHQRQPYTAGKRKDTSHRRIRYTSNNQPYIILASGKARFISKKSVRSSRKRRNGRY